MADFYPRPPRGGRPSTFCPCLAYRWISIHALREEGDVDWDIFGRLLAKFLSTPSARRATRSASATAMRPLYFYPRPPRGGRPQPVMANPYTAEFLSTPSARRATLSVAFVRGSWQNFYPRPPRGGRLRARRSRYPVRAISIHALREEGDFKVRVFGPQLNISIHALREEGDLTPDIMKIYAKRISIHALREEGDGDSKSLAAG